MAFNKRLNRLGADGWELIAHQPIPLTGSIMTDNIKGYAYLAIFKRPKAATLAKDRPAG